MKHVYVDSELEGYAADTLDQAKECQRSLIGDEADDPGCELTQAPDDEVPKGFYEDETGDRRPNTKTWAELASLADHPQSVWSTQH